MTLDTPRSVQTTAPSFAAVAEELLDDVYGYLLYLTKNWAVAEDLTSETFEVAFKKWRRFDPRRGTPRAWLLAIARTTALDWFRADSRRRRREERADTAEPRREAGDGFGEGLSPALENGLRALTAGEREVVALRVVLDLDGEETARLLGITPTAVSTRLSRALAKLEERMSDNDVV
ncbi:MAG: RNA polymerase sigma factor [Thermoleophilia bacterium]|nr:RNA polymerase sigma factor [Thermoleophilia bacterium]